MSPKSTSNSAIPQDQFLPPGSVSVEEITGYLKGALQAVRIAYLFVGRLMARVRESKLYAELGYADMESYSRDRLQLGRAALYSYLRVYDWAAKNHPEWLDPKPGTFIPELNDVVDLMWMEKELEQRSLKPAAKAGLEALKAKALDGSLTKSEVTAFRSRTRNTAADGRKTFLSRMRKLRTDGAAMSGIPHEVISNLDEAIAILKNAISIPVINLEQAKGFKKAKVA